jgi:hypothetical protein
MPRPVFGFDLNPSTNAPMQDLAWDPWTWEVFCGQFTAGTIYPPRQTAVLTRCAPPDDANRCMARCIDGKAGRRLLADQRQLRTWLAERRVGLPTAEDRVTAAVAEARNRGIAADQDAYL